MFFHLASLVLCLPDIYVFYVPGFGDICLEIAAASKNLWIHLWKSPLNLKCFEEAKLNLLHVV